MPTLYRIFSFLLFGRKRTSKIDTKHKKDDYFSNNFLSNNTFDRVSVNYDFTI